MPVHLDLDTLFQTVVTRTGALAADLDPTPATVLEAEVIDGTQSPGIGVYWNATGIVGATTIDIELWALDGSLGAPAYVLVDKVVNVPPLEVVPLRARGSTNFCLRIKNPQLAGGVSAPIVRAFADPSVLSTVESQYSAGGSADAVKLEDAASATRAKVAATGSIAEGNNVVGVHDPVQGATTDAAVTTDAAGTHSGKLRGLVKLIGDLIALLPVSIGQKAAAGSLSIIEASDTSLAKESGGNLATLAGTDFALESGGNLADAASGIGAPGDAKVDTDAAGSLSAKLRGVVSRLGELIALLPSSIGQKAAAGSLSVIEASDTTLAKESGGNLDTIAGDTTSLDGKVTACDTSSIAGTVTANAGTNLNTSALALESGGNLDTIAGDTTSLDSKVPALGSALAADSSPVTVATDDVVSTGIVSIAAEVVRLDLTAAPTPVSIDTSTASTTGLTVGTTYAIWATMPCFIKVGDDSVTAALTDVPLGVGIEAALLWTPSADDTDDGVAVIASVAGGTLYVQPCVA